MRAIVEGGLFSCVLTSLDLKSNLVGFEGATLLVESEVFNGRLMEVDLRTNPLTAPGRQKLRDCVDSQEGCVLRV